VPDGRLMITGVTPTAGRWVEGAACGHRHMLAPPELVVRSCPVAPDLLPATFAARSSYTAAAAEVAELPDAFVCDVEGTVVTADGLLVADLTRAWRRPTADHPIWTSPPKLPARQLTGTAAVIAARGADHNVSHFICDSLPRLALLRDLGIKVDHWLVSSVRQRWQRDALELLGMDPDQVVALDEHPFARAERLLVPSRTGFAPSTAPWARRRLHALLPSPSPFARRPQRLLISRRAAQRRRLDNEADLAAHLAPLGFDLIAMEDLPFVEQLALVATAEVIVATHGAALGWILTAPPGRTLIEIANPIVPHDEYWGLASLAGWTYALVLARTTRPAPNANHADLEIDPHTVVHLVPSR